MKRLGNKKAFTLIELLVVIAVLGVLVLLAAPRFLGHTQKAELTKGFANARTIEKASELHYMDHEDWPRLTDEPYTSEEVESYSERIFDRTGYEVNLDPEGNYYDIDYDKLSEYVQVPDDKKNYILQNPVGKVYYMENLTEVGITRVNYSSTKEGLMNPIVSREPTGEEIAIDSADKLAKIGTEYPLDGEYILTANINLSGYSKEEGWVPIGSYTSNTNKSPFTGTFDGNGYSITGLTLNRPTENYVGLFGYTEGAIISNVGLISHKVTGSGGVGSVVGQASSSTKISNSYSTGSVTGTTSVGGLVGYADSSTIETSYATGSVEGSGIYTGGLVGQSNSSTISNSYATGSVTGRDYAGGFVGRANGKTRISNSYATGKVTGSDRVGGLVGLAYDSPTGSSTIENSYATGSVEGVGLHVGGLVGRASSRTNISNSYATGSVKGTGYSVGGLVGWASNSTISNSYATGSVTGTSQVGGLVGSARNSSTGSNTIRNSYATGSVEGVGGNVGGLVGQADSKVYVYSSYWGTVTTGQSTSAKGTGKTTDEMMKQMTYENWDFVNVWEIDEGNDYPKLR